MDEPKDPEAELVRRLSKVTPHSIERIPLGGRLGRPGKCPDLGAVPKAEKPSDEKELK